MLTDMSAPCPCASGKSFENCCAPRLMLLSPAATAEQLMRSRYTAFSLGAVDYLINTLASERRSVNERRMLEREIRHTKWVKLEILDTVAGGITDKTGVVEFNAYFEAGNEQGCLHERSDFRKDGERWVYVGGQVEVK